MATTSNRDEPYGYHLHITRGGGDLDPETFASSGSSENAADHVFAQSACWGIGPLSVCVSLNGSNIDVTIKLLGITVATFTIDPSNPQVCVDVSAGVASAKLCVKVDFNAKCVSVNGEVCVVFAGCTSFNQTIFCW